MVLYTNKKQDNIFVGTKIKQNKINKEVIVIFLIYIFLVSVGLFSYKIGKPMAIKWWQVLPQSLKGILIAFPFVAVVYTVFITWIDHKWGYWSKK